jgi:hypothetical protein
MANLSIKSKLLVMLLAVSAASIARRSDRAIH